MTAASGGNREKLLGRGQQDASDSEADAGSRNPGSGIACDDGEGKAAEKWPLHSDRQRPLSEQDHHSLALFHFSILALSGAHTPALPKGEPF